MNLRLNPMQRNNNIKPLKLDNIGSIQAAKNDLVIFNAGVPFGVVMAQCWRLQVTEQKQNGALKISNSLA